MSKEFVIKGINPANGRVVEMRVAASTEIDAKRRAEEAGLTRVTVSQTGAQTAGQPTALAPEVLVVDDHEDTRAVMVRLLEDDGYLARGVAGGTEALQLMRTHTPSLVITDFTMPGMNGLELLAAIRGDAALKKVPVIIFSARNGDIRASAILAGVDAYVSKNSMDWADLRREILRLAGPGTRGSTLPRVPKPRIKDAG